MDNTYPTLLKVTKLLDSILVLKQINGTDFFTASSNSLVIGIRNLGNILQFLVMNGMLDPQILEVILEEYYSRKKGAANARKIRDEENAGNFTIG